MKNEQFIINIEAVIEELEEQDVMLFRKEEFLNSMTCRNERHNGRAFVDTLCDNMLNEDDVYITLHKKLASIQEERIQLLAEMDLLEELKIEAYDRIEIEESAVELGTFFEKLFEKE